MKIIRNMAVAAVMTVASAVFMMGGSSVVANAAAKNCTIKPLGATLVNGVWVNAGQHFINHGNSMTAQFTVSGDSDCKISVTFASWKAPSGKFTSQNINQQKLFAHVTGTYGVGTHTITVPLPNCFFQADLLLGTAATAPNGTPDYMWGQLLGFVQGGTQKCVEKPVVVTKVVNKTVTKNVTTTAQPTSQPSQLVNTGPGDVAAIFGLTTVAGVVAHKLYSRRFGRQS